MDSTAFAAAHKSDLTSHFSLTECGRRPKHSCLVCNETFPTLFRFKTHQKTHSVFNCSKCVDAFSTYDELFRHSKSHASNHFQCTVCYKKFLKETVFRSHMAKHFAVNAFKCLGCGKDFASMIEFRNHRIHSTTCKKQSCSYIDTTGLTVGRKWYKCDLCKDRFKYQESLEKHRIVHGEYCIATMIRPHRQPTDPFAFGCRCRWKQDVQMRRVSGMVCIDG